MKLSNAEKLILVMLSDITEKLHIDHGIDPKLIKSAIHSGNTWAIDSKYPGLGEAEETMPPLVSEITNILEMWTYIEEGYKELGGDDKALVKTSAGLANAPRYNGFDRDTEAREYNIAYFLIYDLKLFKKFKHDDASVRGAKMATYQAMYKVWETIKPTLKDEYLNARQLISILTGK